MNVESVGEMGKDCSNFVQPVLENIDGRSRIDGSRELIPVFYKSHRKGQPSPPLALEYLVG